MQVPQFNPDLRLFSVFSFACSRHVCVGFLSVLQLSCKKNMHVSALAMLHLPLRMNKCVNVFMYGAL